jgi:hypothetical protein
MALVGVQELARRLNPPRSKGTISKHAAAGKIPVAGHDERASAVRRRASAGGRRAGNQPADAPSGCTGVQGAMPAPELADDDELEQPERRSPGLRASSSSPGGSGLQQQLVMERRLRNRRLVRQIGEDEGRLVLRAVVEEEQATIARRTRDSVTAFLANKASAAYPASFRRWFSLRMRAHSRFQRYSTRLPQASRASWAMTGW